MKSLRISIYKNISLNRKVGIWMRIYDYFLILVQVSICILGLIIWKKQNLNLIYGYNSRNVNEEDVKAYTESIGKAHIMMGISTFPLLIIRVTENDIYICIAITAWILGFIKGIGKIIKTQKKYKTGMWS